MKNNKFIIGICAFFLLFNFAYATPSSKPDWLYVDKILVAEPEFYFLNSENNELNPVEYVSLGENRLFRYLLFNVTSNAKKFSMAIDNTQIVNTELISLKTEANGLYVLPKSTSVFFSDTSLQENNLVKYNNSILTIYLDDKIVRSYQLGYSPASIKGGSEPNMFISFIFGNLLFSIGVFIVLMFFLIFAVGKAINKKKK